MKCLICKTGTMTPSTTTYFSEIDGCIILVKNVPCQRCDQCGEILYSASVTENLDHFVERILQLSCELSITEYDRIL